MSGIKELIMLVDDDPICNSISKVLLKKKFQNNDDNQFEIISFINPVEGLQFLTGSLNEKKYYKVMVLLDINMPEMTGWEFLEEYESQFKNSKEVNVYILSSSVSKCDIERAEKNSNVVEFISKPLKSSTVEKLYEAMV